jgi:hypothetical protein
MVERIETKVDHVVQIGTPHDSVYYLNPDKEDKFTRICGTYLTYGTNKKVSMLYLTFHEMEAYVKCFEKKRNDVTNEFWQNLIFPVSSQNKGKNTVFIFSGTPSGMSVSNPMQAQRIEIIDEKSNFYENIKQVEYDDRRATEIVQNIIEGKKNNKIKLYPITFTYIKEKKTDDELYYNKIPEIEPDMAISSEIPVIEPEQQEASGGYKKRRKKHTQKSRKNKKIKSKKKNTKK